jgi:signal transduction histidine kinase
MASSAERRLAAASGAGWRLFAAAALVVLLLQILAATRHFASAVLLAGAAALLLLEAARLITRRRVQPDVSGAVLRAAARKRDEALALLDSVTVALFVLSADGRIRFANLAARRLAAGDAARLKRIAPIGEEAAARILALPIGGRQIVPLADGRTMLVWVGGLASLEGGEERLVSMQAVAGELDAVQVAAWHSMSRVLAHEMMNSLTPIASLSESLARMADASGVPHDAAAAARTIAGQSRHLMSFVERYRSIADLPQPVPAAIELPAFVADLEALAGTELRARGVAFAAGAVPPDTIAADADLLRQALLNLLRNAGDAASAAAAAEPCVRFSCTRLDSKLLFEVEDNGPGVAAEHAEEMFVPFFTTKAGGAGIGLPLARQVALAHGGTLEASRNPGGGMTFALSIPA